MSVVVKFPRRHVREVPLENEDEAGRGSARDRLGGLILVLTACFVLWAGIIWLGTMLWSLLAQ